MGLSGGHSPRKHPWILWNRIELSGCSQQWSLALPNEHSSLRRGPCGQGGLGSTAPLCSGRDTRGFSSAAANQTNDMDLWPIILTASFKLLILKQDKQRINNLAEHREPGSSQGSLCNIPPQQLGEDLTPLLPCTLEMEWAVSPSACKNNSGYAPDSVTGIRGYWKMTFLCTAWFRHKEVCVVNLNIFLIIKIKSFQGQLMFQHWGAVCSPHPSFKLGRNALSKQTCKLKQSKNSDSFQ